MRQTDDGSVNGKPFFAPAQTGGVSTTASHVIGPAASTILGLGTQKLNADGTALARIVQKQADANTAANLQTQKQTDILRGMQAVAMGKSLDDVAKEQPWYTRIFGKSDVTVGAELYTQQTLADSVLADIHSNMNVVRELDPDTARTIIQDRFKAATTGIPSIDLQVQGKLLNAFPQVMQTYTKESLKWRQEQADKAQRASFDGAFGLMSTQLKSLALDPTSASGRAEAAATVAEFDLRFERPTGQTDEGYLANVYSAIKSQINRVGTPIVKTGPDGQPQTTYVDAHGVQGLLMSSTFSKLTPEQQTELSALAETKMAHAANKYMVQRVDEIAKLRAWINDPPPGMTVRDVQKAMDRINKEVARDSGSIVPVFDPKEIADRSAQAAGAIAARKEREEAKRLRDLIAAQNTSTDSGKALAAQQMQANMQSYILKDPAGAFAARDAGFLPHAPFDSMVNKLYSESDEKSRINLMRAAPGSIAAAKAERVMMFDTTFNLPDTELAKRPSLVMDMLARYSADKDAGLSEGKLSATYTPERRKVLEEGLNQLKVNTPPDVIAATMWNNVRKVSGPNVAREDHQQAEDIINEQASWGWFSRFFNKSKAAAPLAGITLPEGIKDDFQDALAYEIARHRTNGTNDLKDAGKVALRDLLNPNGGWFEMVGGYPIRKLYKGQQGIGGILADGAKGKYKPIPIDDQQEFMQWVMKRKLNEHGGNLESIRPVYSTASGEVLFHLRAADASDTYNIPITQQELSDLYWNRYKGDRYAGQTLQKGGAFK